MAMHVYKKMPLALIRPSSCVWNINQFLSHTRPLGYIAICHRNYGATVYEPGKKGEYKERARKHLEHITLWEHYKRGIQMIPNEFKKFKAEKWEAKNRIHETPTQHGDYKTLWQFDNEEIINRWVVTTDNDMLEGYSKAEFVLGPNKTGIYRGFLDTQVPEDGRLKQTGYTSLYSHKNLKAFGRQSDYKWDGFTHLVIKVRGDGRTYMVLLKKGGYNAKFDIMQNDLYSFPLFTRGGPYWQYAKIPFSKFFFSHKGRIQNFGQVRINGNLIAQLGIGLLDGNTGPFNLEIASISALRDESHEEDFAYEMYSGPSYSFY